MLYRTILSRAALLAALSPFALAAASAHAQAAPADDVHDTPGETSDEIVVSGTRIATRQRLEGTTVMESEALQANMAGQIGDVLATLPGVSASGFAPGASRPILRGFSGERVKLLVDGIGSIDASNVSADHAVALDPLTAQRIEVVHGPEVLRYGTSVIGGAVNVVDKRIPRRIPESPLHADLLARTATADDLRELGGSVDVPVGGGFVAHVDGSWRRANDIEIPGFAVAEPLRAQLYQQADAAALAGDDALAGELRDAADRRGTVPDTAARTWSANGGLAYLGERGSIGVSTGLYDTRYGIPARPGPTGEEGVSIGLRQLRADMRAELDVEASFIDRITLRTAYSDYTHTEFEDDEPGTVFDVGGLEGRLELEQAERGGWKGSFGGQYAFTDFAVTGEEATLPVHRGETLAGFVRQNFTSGALLLDGAMRVERYSVAAPSVPFSRSFTTLSGAGGVAWQFADAVRAGVNLSRTARAPSAEELLSDGAHIATQAYEIGDRALDPERAWGAEAYLRGRAGPAEFDLSVYKSWFSNYIYLAETGAIREDLPEFAYRQGEASYAGFDAEAHVAIGSLGAFGLIAQAKGSYVRAELSDGTPVPRIPPLVLGGGLSAESDAIDFGVDLEWNAAQRRTAPFETQTEGFTLASAQLTWRPFAGNRGISLIVKGDNLFDVTARRATSFTKDFAPLPGRSLSASLRASF